MINLYYNFFCSKTGILPRRELGDSGRRGLPLAGWDDGGEGSTTEGPLDEGLWPGGDIDAVGDGEGELSDTGRRWNDMVGGYKRLARQEVKLVNLYKGRSGEDRLIAQEKSRREIEIDRNRFN